MSNTKKECFSALLSFIISGDIFLIYFKKVSVGQLIAILFSQMIFLKCTTICIQRQRPGVSVQLPEQPIYNPIVCIEISSDEEIEYNNPCSICLGEETDKLVQLNCKHTFHRDCIEEWHKTRQNTCPNCRSDMTAEDSKEEDSKESS